MAIDDYVSFSVDVLKRHPNNAVRLRLTQCETAIERLYKALVRDGLGDLAEELPVVSTIGVEESRAQSVDGDAADLEDYFDLE